MPAKKTESPQFPVEDHSELFLAKLKDILALAEDYAKPLEFISENGDAHIFVPDGPGKRSVRMVAALNPRLPEDVVENAMVRERDSAVSYLLRYATSLTVGFSHGTAQPEPFIMFVMDYHVPSKGSNPKEKATPSRCKHYLKLSTPLDPNFVEWRKHLSRQISQREFGELLDRMAHTVAEPEAAELIEIVDDVLISTTDWKSAKLNRDTGKYDFSASGTVDANITIPRTITLNMPIYLNTEPQTFVTKLSVRRDPESGEVGFRLIIPSLDNAVRTAFRGLCDHISSATDVPIYHD